MKSAEIRELGMKELLERIEDESSLLVRLKLNHTVSPLDNPHKLTIVKRNIARLKTELNSRKQQENQDN